MPERSIVKEVEIDARTSKVWDVLVRRDYIEQWVKEFSEGNVVTGDWQLGSEVAMTDDDGTVFQTGKVTEFSPNERLEINFEDGAYLEVLQLSAKGGKTLLKSEARPVPETEYDEHAAVWDRGLRKIKELAEAQ